LRAQRYAGPSQELAAPAPPHVSVVSSNTLLVSWPPLDGLAVSGYRIYADGDTNTAAYDGTNTSWSLTGLPLNSTHTFQLGYVIGPQTSPLSLPASGTTYDPTVGAVTNNLSVPENPGAGPGGDVLMKLVFPPKNSAVSASPLPYSALSGVYNGLFCDSNNVATESSGYFTITVSANGGYSGKIVLGGAASSFSGTFVAGHSTRTVTRKGKTPLMLELNLDLYGGDQITGQITDGSWLAAVFAYRAGLGPMRPAPGRYTFVIPGNPGAIGSPAGTGAGTLTVDAKGAVRWSGLLADGVKVSQNTTLSRNNVWPFYACPPGGTESVIGWIKFENKPGSDFYGDVVWNRPAGAVPPFYTGGFTNAAAVWGAYYTPPLASGPFANAELVFSGGNFAVPYSVDAQWDGKKVTAQTATVTFILTTGTGLFKGTVVDPQTERKYPFQGALFEKSAVGLGYFLGSDQSGHVYYGPNP
jgi:hypothetical protein